MSAPVATIAPATVPPSRTSHVRRIARWVRRWYKVTVPLAIAVTLIVVTGVAYVLQTPDTSDDDFLNPASAAPIGGLNLASRLTAAGITIDRVTSTQDAYAAVKGPSTLFIPEPEMVRPDLMPALMALPAGTRIVLVAPSVRTLADAGMPVASATSRWATRTAEPGCAQPQASHAGPAEVDGVEYGDGKDQTARCYHNAFIELQRSGIDVIVIGASDPFRNDRIGEQGNAALATALLSTRPHLIWFDLHTPEVIPPLSAPSTGSVNTQQTLTLESGPASEPTDDGNGARGSQTHHGGTGSTAAPSNKQNSVANLFPAWLWALIGLVGLIGVVLALAAARRLGPPVTEPIPVAARSNEIVEGRGRLYLRSRNPAAALDVLRSATIRRLRTVSGIPSDAARADIVAAMSARSGWEPAQVTDALYGTEPTTNQQLADAVEWLDALNADADL